MNHYKVDLHVHSPASIDYQGDRSTKGYRELVKAYAKAEVQAIAITDHNTIYGYLELCKQRGDSRQMYDLLLSRGDDASELAEEIAAFDQVDVLPGVEISVYPGLHIILIFNENVVSRVSDFLRNDLSLGEAVDKGDPKEVSELSATAVLRKAVELFGDDFFCILPHVESSKGAWQELEGQPRADLVKHDSVLAAQILNPDTPKYINQALKSKAYKRSHKLGYIQASDYHGSSSDEPASQYSIISMDEELNWESLKLVLGDQGRMRLSHEFIDSSYKSFVEGKKMMQTKFTNKLSISEADEVLLLKQITALVNTTDSALVIELFNVGDECSRSPETIANFICDLQLKIDPPEKFGLRVRQFHRSNSRQRYCLTAHSNSSLRVCDGIAWVAGDKGVIRAAKSWEIEQKVINGFHLKYGKFKQESLKKNADDLLMISNSFPAFSIISRTERLFKKERDVEYKVDFKARCKRRPIETVGINGFSSGDYYYVGNSKLKGGRMSDGQKSYYRFSSVIHRDGDSHDVEGDQCERVSPCIVVSRHGGATICLSDLPLSASTVHFVITVNDSDNYEEKVQKLSALLALLKSSFFVWYMATVGQTTDLFDYLISGRKITVPKVTNWEEDLAVNSQKIVKQEIDFLRDLEEAQESDDDVVNGLIEKYNYSILGVLHDIDEEVFRMLSFNESEVRQIYATLSELDVFDYGIGNSVEEFLGRF